jgi:2-polyprenyl-3-methyl-5-hydroxy-6-metoxy-1,4-benzoquinol methylase
MAPDETFERMHYAAQGRMAQLGNYYLWILRNFRGATGRRIWDAGAGIGNVTEHLAASANFVLATEFAQRNLEALRERFDDPTRVRVAHCDLAGDDALAFAELEIDTIVSLDVLEHLEDDLHALRTFWKVLQPGGRALIKVPAHPILFGAIDEASLHLRRYRRRDLRAKLERAGFRVERVAYMNMAATVPYFVRSRLLRKPTNFSNTIDPGRLGLYDRLIPWLERVERVLPVPFGLSLIAVGLKPGASGSPAEPASEHGRPDAGHLIRFR